ncbi:MAG: low molecular weight protein-tyrosine-phosphatase [Actinomycetota bacterium]
MVARSPAGLARPLLRSAQHRFHLAVAALVECCRAEAPLRPPKAPEYRVPFVCLGNICRSPLAHGALRHKLRHAGLAEHVAVESAGTCAKPGGPPDPRARIVAARHGFTIGDLRTRRFSVDDFDAFDRIVVFDAENRKNVLELARGDTDRAKVSLLRADETDVGDPVLGPLSGFERTYAEIDEAAQRILENIRTQSQPNSAA